MEKNIRKSLRNNQKGITLVALVVTVIVLLILAGVSIGLVFNNESLFEKANMAASRHNDSKEEEQKFLQGADRDLNKYNGVYEGSGVDTPNPSGTLTPIPEPTPVLPAEGATVPEAGWTVEEAKGLVERDGLKAHLGEKVQYSPTGDPTGIYRIFYHDNEVNEEDPSKGYFGDPLGTLYLKRDYVKNDTKLSNYTKYIPTDGGLLMKKMNPKWATTINAEAIDIYSEHCVSWLCDPQVWNTNYKVEGVADYAMGGPSVEMYMKAYGVYKEEYGDPDRNSTILINEIENSSGYKVGANGIYENSGYYTNNNTIETGVNNIFMTKGNCYWWLASPSSINNSNILYVEGQYASIYSNPYTFRVNYDRTNGLCPIVAISK